jgi:hypothetical protein
MYLFGWIWGLLFTGATIVVNQNYEAFKAFTDAGNSVISLAILAFILGSLFIVAVMIISGLLQGFAGRKMPRRWATLVGVGLGVACASFALKMMPVTL